MVVDNEREDSAKRYRDPLICDILVAMREEHRTGMSLPAMRRAGAVFRPVRRAAARPRWIPESSPPPGGFGL